MGLNGDMIERAERSRVVIDNRDRSVEREEGRSWTRNMEFKKEAVWKLD